MKPIPESIKSKRILIVDDAKSMRALLAAILREFGITRIDEADDGEQAFQKIKVSGYDLVLCDWEMPKMSGIDLLKKVRDDESINQVPFVMVTSLSNTDKVKQAIAVGTNDYVVKPINTETIMSKVVGVLSRTIGSDAPTSS